MTDRASRATRIRPLFVLSLLGCQPTPSAPATPEAAFWSWFADNEQRLFTFESDQDAVFAELGRRMESVHQDLAFEFGPVRDGRREFVLSAGGSVAAFSAVEALHAVAPELARWTCIAFRPRRTPLNDLAFGEKQVRVDDVHYLLAKDGDRVGVVFFFDGDVEKRTYAELAFLFLDEALGERDVETRVGFVECEPRSSKHFAEARTLRELPHHFDSVAKPGGG